MFGENCSVCHGADAQGGNGGPNITNIDSTEAQILQQIEKGGGGMPGFETTLTPQQIADVRAYVLQLNGR